MFAKASNIITIPFDVSHRPMNTSLISRNKERKNKKRNKRISDQITVDTKRGMNVFFYFKIFFFQLSTCCLSYGHKCEPTPIFNASSTAKFFSWAEKVRGYFPRLYIHGSFFSLSYSSVFSSVFATFSPFVLNNILRSQKHLSACILKYILQPHN